MIFIHLWFLSVKNMVWIVFEASIDWNACGSVLRLFDSLKGSIIKADAFVTCCSVLWSTNFLHWTIWKIEPQTFKSMLVSIETLRQLSNRSMGPNIKINDFLNRILMPQTFKSKLFLIDSLSKCSNPRTEPQTKDLSNRFFKERSRRRSNQILS